MISMIPRCQNAMSGLLIYADAYFEKSSAIGTAGYTSSLAQTGRFLVAMQGERLFGTDISYYEVALGTGIKNTGGLGLTVTRKGTDYLSDNAINLGFGKKLGDRMQLGIRLGYQYINASGYGSNSSPVAGLGFGLKINEQCKWLFQADRLNSFFKKEDVLGYRIRTGFGYKFSAICFGTMEILSEPGISPRFIGGVHYSPADPVMVRAGISNDLFLLTGQYYYHDFDIGVNISWHMMMGISTGLFIGYAPSNK